MTRSLVALPIYNERAFVEPVLDEVRRYAEDILVVDDGSTDGSGEILVAQRDIYLIRHRQNLGYGAALRSAFSFAVAHHYEVLVTIDCDGQHEPCFIPEFIDAAKQADIVSGSRYLKKFPGDSTPPEDRRQINRLITDELNRVLGLSLTDAFCGFKAYRVEALRRLEVTESGYAMPLEVWVQAARYGLRIVELPIPLVYFEERRSFGGALDDAKTRLAMYRRVLRESICRYWPEKASLLQCL
ncbi:MAG: glycosyltransferase family 2 protein [Thermoguttaceae bacterium]|nr:glycosyltransferase family 2 protein [Thermoguttaceae bacterium]MDW8077345.1 glycosyltransferase family 2 protein [Thermoguttaceae bacterium]